MAYIDDFQKLKGSIIDIIVNAEQNDVFVDVRFMNLSIVLSRIGGIFTVLYTFIFLIVGLFSYTCFVNSLARHMVIERKIRKYGHGGDDMT